jgi:hypothetical protein
VLAKTRFAQYETRYMAFLKQKFDHFGSFREFARARATARFLMKFQIFERGPRGWPHLLPVASNNSSGSGPVGVVIRGMLPLASKPGHGSVVRLSTSVALRGMVAERGAGLPS